MTLHLSIFYSKVVIYKNFLKTGIELAKHIFEISILPGYRNNLRHLDFMKVFNYEIYVCPLKRFTRKQKFVS